MNRGLRTFGRDFDNTDFDKNFSNISNHIQRAQKGMGCGFLLVILVNILIIGGVIFGIVKGVQYVSHKGLKNIVGDVWNGDSTNTLNTVNKVGE